MRWKLAKIGFESAIAFAAEELKRCLQRMDENAEVGIYQYRKFQPELEGCLWLGVCDAVAAEVSDPSLDDAFSIEVVQEAGKIVGSNPRSVLFGVYRFLKELGCSWVRPGMDGEYIPKMNLQGLDIRIHEKAAYRHRGICIEGSVSYDHVADIIDWMPKLCYNAYFIQFNNPVTFFNRWYEHRSNPILKGKPLTGAEIAALRDQCIVEIKKRGLLFHTAGHGWTCEPFGIPGEAWEPRQYDVPEKSVQYLAQVNGKRELWGNVPLNTNLCYSNPAVRSTIASAVTQRCKAVPEIDYAQVWLADGTNNHCECANCRKMRPSDWYVTLLNDIDRELTAADLPTKVVFLLYVDLLWEPQEITLNNPDRFTLMFAPITRTYSASIADAPEFDESKLPEFELNHLRFPESVGENLAWMRRWRRRFSGDGFDFDYHFMWDHFCDPGYYEMAKILFRDMQGLKKVGLNGMVSCQNQRVFFPNAMGMVAMAAALWDENADFDKVAREYFTTAYGHDGETVRTYMQTISRMVDPVYIRGEKGRVNPEAAASLAQVPCILDGFLPVIERAAVDDSLPLSVQASWRYLRYHSELCRLFVLTFQKKAEGCVGEALAAKERALDYAFRHEMELHHVLDVYEFQLSVNRYFEK